MIYEDLFNEYKIIKENINKILIKCNLPILSITKEKRINKESVLSNTIVKCKLPISSIIREKRINKRLVFDNTIVKCKLTSILKNKDWLPIIQNRVYTVNMIKLEAYFFFNIYIMKILEEKEPNINFDKNTIERSVLFVLNKYDNIRVKDQEYDKMLQIYNNNYVPIGESKIIEYSKIAAISNPFNYIAVELMTNIINHLNLNFKRNQKLYIKVFVNKIFKDFNFKKGILYSITNLIIHYVNKQSDNLIIYSKKLANLENINELIPLMQNLIEKLKDEIPDKIKNKIVDFNLKSNYIDVLKYYYFMLNYLEINNNKRFSLLPQLGLQYSYIRFDSRFISTIYDELQTKENKVGIKQFVCLRSRYSIIIY